MGKRREDLTKKTYVKPSTKKNKPVDIVKGSSSYSLYYYSLYNNYYYYSLYYCWVAREVYGADNPQWLVFRDWMLNSAPSWLRALYGRYGERFARFISDKPRIKAIIRKGMDKVTEERLWMDGQVWSVTR